MTPLTRRVWSIAFLCAIWTWLSLGLYFALMTAVSHGLIKTAGAAVFWAGIFTAAFVGIGLIPQHEAEPPPVASCGRRLASALMYGIAGAMLGLVIGTLTTVSACLYLIALGWQVGSQLGWHWLAVRAEQRRPQVKPDGYPAPSWHPERIN